MKKSIAVLLTLAVLWNFSSCSGPAGGSAVTQAPKTSSDAAQNTSVAVAQTEETTEKTQTSAEQLLASMTLEEKVGQLFIIDPGMLADNFQTSEASSQLLSRIKKYNPGGFIFFKPNIQTPEQTQRLIAGLQSATMVRPFLGVDEEGGIVSRIGSNPEMGFKKQPAMETIGATGDPGKAYQVGTELASGLHQLGFNLDFAPVADVNTNPDNPVIGSRAFGDDPELVASMVAQEVIGLQDGGVSACLKHFPGHGDTSTDTHTGLAKVSHDLERLRSVELIPFRAGIEAGADMIMVAHISLPKVTGDEEPASISPQIVTGLLRGELGYDGVVITDSMIMQALYDKYTLAESTILALKAGVDILLFQTPEASSERGTPSQQFEEAYQAVLEAVALGELTEERVNQSVLRILELKIKRGIIEE